MSATAHRRRRLRPSILALVPLLAVFEAGCGTGIASLHRVPCDAPEGSSCSLGTLAAGDHDARLLVSQYLDGASPVHNPHPIGVRYDTGGGEWRVFNQDGADVPVGATFHVAEVHALLLDDFESQDLLGWSTSEP